MSIILDGTAGITLPTGAEVVSTTGTQTLTNKSISADQVNSGTIATARLGSGTADSTTFLRGDQTWATVSVDVMGTIAGASVGAVGTYGFMQHTTSADYAPGATLSGASLRYVGIAHELAASYTDSSTSQSFGYATSIVYGSTASGTWRCMGVGTNIMIDYGAGSKLTRGTSLWLRIS